MSFVTGLLIIDAPASALNNAGKLQGSRFENAIGAKVIRTREGTYPYVSAQSFRYWLRETLIEKVQGWKASPVYKESNNVAYTYADPITYWDDDLFGYMRAPSGDAEKQRRDDPKHQDLPPMVGKEKVVTRVSPFRVGTLVSIAPVTMNEDNESMTRHEGDPVLYMNQFYRATLKGLFSLNLGAAGKFSYIDRTGFRNLSTFLQGKAKEMSLDHSENQKSYHLPKDERLKRILALFEGMAQLEGGAKQALHYTDVTPALVVMAVTKGGNHIFGHVVGANGKGLLEVKQDAFEEALTVFKDEILSTVYVGWVKGYLDEERAKFEEFAKGKKIQISHPREAYQALIKDFEKNQSWLD